MPKKSQKIDLTGEINFMGQGWDKEDPASKNVKKIKITENREFYRGWYFHLLRFRLLRFHLWIQRVLGINSPLKRLKKALKKSAKSAERCAASMELWRQALLEYEEDTCQSQKE